MVAMRFIAKILVAVAVLGGFCVWLMYNGHWNSVIALVDEAISPDAAEHLDNFGQISKEVSEDVSVFGGGLYEQLKSGETVTIDWGAVKDYIDGFRPPSNERQPNYDRAKFGNGWLDPDGNGCDARNDTLARDLTQTTIDTNGCTVLSGVLKDPYTGKTITFQRGASSSAAVQIDHVVPLAYAWRAGAWKWTDQQRAAFANDPINLLAVDGPSNIGKSDKTIGRWLPPQQSFHCTYTAIYVSVHEKYDLPMDTSDSSAAARIIDGCR